MRSVWVAAASVLLTGCITSLRDFGGSSVDKTPVDSPVYAATPSVMFETCAKALEEEDYKVTKADRKAGVLQGEVVMPSSLDREGVRLIATIRLEKRGTGSVVHVSAVKQINTNIDNPLDEKNAKWKDDERATDAEQKLLFKLSHKLGDEAKEAAEDYRKRHESPTPAAVAMTEPLETDRWKESCPFHTDADTVWQVVRSALAPHGILAEDRKSGQLETPWKEEQGVDGHWTRWKAVARVEPTRFDVIVKVMVKLEMTDEAVSPRAGGKATWVSIGYKEEMEREILLDLTMQLKG